MSRIPKKKIITNKKDLPMFVTWTNDKEKELAMASSANALNNVEPIFHNTQAGLTCINRAISFREGNRGNCPDDSLLGDVKDIISRCMWAYKRVSVLRNIIDLMADFSCQGIEIVHPDKKVENFLQNWATRIGFIDRSERFLNLLYRAGNVVVQRTHAQLKLKDVKRLEQGTAADIDTNPDMPEKPKLRQIPWNYVINSPLNIEIIGGEELAMFSGKVQYAIRVPSSVISKIKEPKNADERLILSNIPDYIISAVKSGKTLIPLSDDKISVYHYKKDDWEGWAEPLPGAILEDIVMLNKLKLADISALDGAISHVRLWKLGSLEHKIYPTEAAVARLADMLSSAVGGGAIDIIWGPELEIKETATDIYKFLGSEKYGPALTSIYDGMGIPIALTGFSAQSSSGNNYLPVKTLVERLEYGRSVLVDFWLSELKEIQQAFGFKDGASVRFGKLNLHDEAAILALYIQLADRNLVSIETIQERFGEIPELEALRQRREEKQMDSGKRVRKASQWQDPVPDQTMKKIFAQTGQTTPGENGVELEDRKPGEKSLVDHKNDQADKALQSKEAQTKLRGVPGQGRTKGQKDKQKRKSKTGAPIQQARANVTEALMWARSAQESISKIINPIYLQTVNKKNMRSLSEQEFKDIENLKFSLLCNLKPSDEVNEETVGYLINREEQLLVSDAIYELCKVTSLNFSDKYDREPTTEETRQIQASVYALYIGGDNNG